MKDWLPKKISINLIVTVVKLKELYEEVTQPYVIYCDMDGVLVDFHKRFEGISGGLTPNQYRKEHGMKGFWDIIKKDGVGFWAGMSWMPDGKKLWNFIKPYKPTLLSAPSIEKDSRLGKRLWVRNNLPGVKLILASKDKKPNYSGPNHILIDDYEPTIDLWKAQGGIGILHTSANSTIEELKKLGL